MKNWSHSKKQLEQIVSKCKVYEALAKQQCDLMDIHEYIDVRCEFKFSVDNDVYCKKDIYCSEKFDAFIKWEENNIVNYKKQEVKK